MSSKKKQSASNITKRPERSLSKGECSSSDASNVHSPVKAAWTSPLKSGSPMIAYVHNLSPLKRNRKNTLDYSTLTLQTKGERKDALLYSKTKRPLLVNSVDSHTPVKIQRYTFTSDGQKVIINDMTTISSPNQTDYTFQFEEEPVVSKEPTVISSITSLDEWDLVTVVAKAVHVTDPVFVTAKDGSTKLKLAECTLADKTGAIVIDVWEDHISKVRTGSVYRIKEAQIRRWNGNKKLSTAVASVIEEISDEGLSGISVAKTDLLTAENVKNIKVTSIYCVEQVESYHHCVKCSRRLLQLCGSAFAHCDRCGGTMRAKDCEIHICAKVVVQQDDKEKVRLTAFESTLQDALKCDISTLSENEIAERLLQLDKVSISYNPKTLVIKKLSLAD